MLTVLLILAVVALWSRTAFVFVRDRRRQRGLPVAYIDSRRSRAT